MTTIYLPYHNEMTFAPLTYPVKLYIRDVFIVKKDDAVKSVYTIHNMQFKKIQIHGIITNVLLVEEGSISFELTDVTATIDVHYSDSCKKLERKNFNSITRQLESTNIRDKVNYETYQSLHRVHNLVEDNLKFTAFQKGDYVSVVGKISNESSHRKYEFLAFDCKKSSSEMDTIWMMDLNNLYQKFYTAGR